MSKKNYKTIKRFYLLQNCYPEILVKKDVFKLYLKLKGKNTELLNKVVQVIDKKVIYNIIIFIKLQNDKSIEEKMIPEERRTEILSKLKNQDIYTINNLTSELGVSRVTIQRDINLLDERGLVHKVHGGVKLKSETDTFIESRFSARLKQNCGEKLEIAKKAINYVNDYSTIFIDSSTTSYIFTKELFKMKFVDLNIITNSPAILCEALNYPDLKIISTGGQLKQNFNMLYGKWVISFLEKVNIDSAFISAAGISTDMNITSSDTELANILTVIFSRSKEVNLLIGSTKFFKAGMLDINPVNQCRRIITDSRIDDETILHFKEDSKIELVY